MPNNEENAGPIPGKDLYSAMRNLGKSLGPDVVQLIVADLQRHGITFAGSESYPLKRIEEALKETFGEDGCELLIEMIRKSLSEL
ncbi:MAG TPA: hypothetical protein VHA09_01160 [Nitrososphaera sp.]|nr:hypothetical protein [Nitrososphaera sp.]